jgi:phenylacetate-CoA ligase
MLIIRGVNVYPSQVESAITGVEGAAPRYMLVVSQAESREILEVQVEYEPGFSSAGANWLEGLRTRVNEAVEHALGLSAKIRVMEPGSIERSEGKSRRVIDRRDETSRNEAETKAEAKAR